MSMAVGSSGPDVKELQQKLTEAGFSRGLVDGIGAYNVGNRLIS
jgi:peptidoglycan hydrolase-like protein with peptidoglycan-binding domain